MKQGVGRAINFPSHNHRVTRCGAGHECRDPSCFDEAEYVIEFDFFSTAARAEHVSSLRCKSHARHFALRFGVPWTFS